jgi:hypothetical protein
MLACTQNACIETIFYWGILRKAAAQRLQALRALQACALPAKPKGPPGRVNAFYLRFVGVREFGRSRTPLSGRAWLRNYLAFGGGNVFF